MPTLTLTVLRCPDAVTPEQRQVKGGELTLGRGTECDWPLADPDKDLSRKHCRLELLSGSWRVRDLSSNGTFVNFGTTPIGRDQAQEILDGDRLRLGSYEIEVRITADAHPTGEPFGLRGSARTPIEAPSPRGNAAPLPGLEDDLPMLGGAGIGSGARGRGAPLLPDDFDAAGVPDAPMADHRGATSEAFQVRPVVSPGKPLIPDDWDLDINSERAPVPQPVSPRRASAAAEITTNRENVRAPSQESRATNLAGESNPFDAAGGQPQAAAGMRAPAPPRPAPSSVSDKRAALVMMLAAADLPPGMVARAAADPDAALRAAGGLLRLAVAGIRALLIARNEVKREFRIEQTMLRAKNNNPLKFAATDEQALASLLDPRTPSLRALQDSIDDLTTHQIATLAATQAAARALLDRLAPANFEAEDKDGGFIPGTREKRLWETYKRSHAKLIEQFEDDFESAFGKAFARAYEQAAVRAKD
ncbi:MAG: type VI secretion system-associated FHA domain protein TagH [Burkholderiales bacterium]